VGESWFYHDAWKRVPATWGNAQGWALVDSEGPRLELAHDAEVTTELWRGTISSYGLSGAVRRWRWDGVRWVLDAQVWI
jgi:hypothetical protein